MYHVAKYEREGRDALTFVFNERLREVPNKYKSFDLSASFRASIFLPFAKMVQLTATFVQLATIGLVVVSPSKGILIPEMLTSP